MKPNTKLVHLEAPRQQVGARRLAECVLELPAEVRAREARAEDARLTTSQEVRQGLPGGLGEPAQDAAARVETDYDFADFNHPDDMRAKTWLADQPPDPRTERAVGRMRRAQSS